MGGTCSDCNGWPVPFKQNDLVSVRVGDIVASRTGCGNLMSPYENCAKKGFTFPKNKEYMQVDSPAAGRCGMCTGDPGCSCDSTCTKPGGYTGGSRCAITRTSFQGNKAGCCLIGGGGRTIGTCEPDKLVNCPDPTIQWDKIYDDTYTCNVDSDPYGNSGGVNCPQEVAKVCSNYSDYPNTFKQWEPDGYCYKWVMNSGGDTEAVAPVLTSALDNFTNLWGIDLPKDSYAPMRKHLSNLLSICRTDPYGQVCSASLERLCSRKNPWNKNRVTRDDVSTAFSNIGDLNSSNIVSACGCHLDQQEYREYVKDGIVESNTNACDPLCKLPGTIPKWSCPVQGQPCVKATCSQNICVIDNVTIDIINSNVGDITFNVACGGCEGGNCLCIFSDINILNQASNVGNIDFNTSCGGNCMTVDPTTGIPDKKVPCPGGKPSPPSPGGGGNTWWEWISKEKWLIMIGSVILIVISLIIWYWWNHAAPPIPSTTSTPAPVTDEYYPGGIQAYYGAN